MLDADIVLLRDIRELHAEFARFGPRAVLGVARETAAMYGDEGGFNGGVQLLDLARMRNETYGYDTALDHLASGAAGQWVGRLCDQSVYTLLTRSSVNRADLVHELPCEWNRQIGGDWFNAEHTPHWRDELLLGADHKPHALERVGARNQSLHVAGTSIPMCASNRSCAALHPNFVGFKCIGTFMQACPTCAVWDAFQRALEFNSSKSVHDLLLGGCPSLPYAKRTLLLAILRRFYGACCVHAARWRAPMRPPDGMAGALVVSAALRSATLVRASPSAG